MIIQRRGTEHLFITQAGHAAMAGAIMAGWELGGLPDHPRRAAILAATVHHDDGWAEEDAQMHVGGAGEPLDFISVPPPVKQRIWPRAAARAAARSSYVAALVAEHALTVHAPFRDDPAWRAFFADMARLRDAHLAQAGGHERPALPADYPFVRAGDQLSLILCNAWTEPLSGPGYRAVLAGTTLRITPDPFGGRRIPLAVEARMLPVRSYPSAAVLRQVYDAAAVVRLEGAAVGA